MLFAISIDDDKRAILDQTIYGETVALIEAKSWIAARREALKQDGMNPFNYKPGHGWHRKDKTQ